TKNSESITVNLGSGKGLSVFEMINTARKITGRGIPSINVERRAGDPACLYAVSEKAKKLLDWETKYSDADTLIRTTWNVYNKK
ncbi:MAG: UDP-glucose 4-epimerase GalE, partial [Spirochaetaceae bacterium]|nr:UDP-glucose 4-epimerase GalE [Spirochaetaceae bacterium]